MRSDCVLSICASLSFVALLVLTLLWRLQAAKARRVRYRAGKTVLYHSHAFLNACVTWSPALFAVLKISVS